MREQWRKFAEHYIELADIKEAALAAGYSENYAEKKAYQLLRKPEVKDYLDELVKRLEDESIANATEVMQYLTSVLRKKSTSTEIVIEGQGDGFSEARLIEKPPNEKERLKAAELLGKRYALFTEKVETDVDMDLNITVDYGRETEDKNETD